MTSTTKTTAKGRTKSSAATAKAQGAQDELAKLINESKPLRQLRDEMEHYPVELFGKVCSISNERGAPAPDYALGLTPFLGDVALRALEQSDLINRVDHDIHAMHAYEPTSMGKQLWKRLEAERAKE